MAIDRTKYVKGGYLVGGAFPADESVGKHCAPVTETVTETPRRPPLPRWSELQQGVEALGRTLEEIRIAVQARRR